MEKTINTHEKLLKEFMDMDKVHEFLKSKGYDKGKEHFIGALFFGINETDLYLHEGNLSESEKLTEEQYFKMLTEKMNWII